MHWWQRLVTACLPPAASGREAPPHRPDPGGIPGRGSRSQGGSKYADIEGTFVSVLVRHEFEEGHGKQADGENAKIAIYLSI